jgi:hypothetical protein
MMDRYFPVVIDVWSHLLLFSKGVLFTPVAYTSFCYISSCCFASVTSLPRFHPITPRHHFYFQYLFYLSPLLL